jgi:PAS domain S-box-containing protein
MTEKLLVLDDEPLILTSLEYLFEDDYEVFTTSDAEAALQLARDHDFAVILCDEHMPGVCGHEFLRRVRQLSRATRVMMSGYADMTELTDAVNSGQIFAYIAKPWEAPNLKAQVGAAVLHFKLMQEVEQEHGLLRALMENIPDLIYFKDCQSRFTMVNLAHASNLGASDPGECIGKSNADYFDPSDALRWRREEMEMIESGRPVVDRIEQIKYPRGAASWWSTTKVPMFDRKGQVSGIAGISRDITSLKNNEEMLREQNERNRMILQTANDAFIGMDSDGSIAAWNPRAQLIFGWAAKEVMGRRWSDIVIAPAYREAHTQGVEHFLATEGSLLNIPMELVALHRDGHEFPVEATVWPVRVRGECSFNAFLRDISERRRVDAARKKKMALVQLLHSVTVAANRSSTIEHTAQTCLGLICSHTGWPVGHVYLRANNSPVEPFSIGFWHLDDIDRFAAFREISDRLSVIPGAGLSGRVLASGKPEWIVDLSDKVVFPRAAEVGAAGLRSGFGFPVLVKDEIIAILEFFSLQTVQPDDELLTVMARIGSQLEQVIIRQRADEDLRYAKVSAESANRAKSEFLTTMSHEMRAPMNAILGMADLLAESPLHEDQQDYVRIFRRAGANLLELINDILDLSKVEAGHVELESIGFDLGALLKKVIEMMRSRAQDRGLQLNLEIAPSVPPGLIGDPNRLRQILTNLVGNALKFTERGFITLRVEPELGLQEPGSIGLGGAVRWLRFSVADTGIGIAADKTEMIFGRFNQADSSTTREYGGTGLGLAISKGLVDLMGGRIGCTSEVGEGSIFFVTAPFGIAELEAPGLAESPAIAIIPAGSEQHPVYRILIAEDSRDNLALIKAYLRGPAFELAFAEDGKIAVEKTISGHPHLVLMDLQMPVMGGLEATRAIRKWEQETHAYPIPILALTAHAAPEGGGQSLEAGCDEHLTKPINKATLVEAIVRHLSGKIRITPPEGIEEMVPTYLANVRRDMQEILARSASKDCGTARRLGHDFKGSGEGYGFPEITRTGAAVELAAIAFDEEEIRAQILALSAYLDRVEIV